MHRCVKESSCLVEQAGTTPSTHVNVCRGVQRNVSAAGKETLLIKNLKTKSHNFPHLTGASYQTLHASVSRSKVMRPNQCDFLEKLKQDGGRKELHLDEAENC